MAASKPGSRPEEEVSSPGPLAIGVEIVQDLTKLSAPDQGFLRRHRHRLKTVFDDGTRTETYIADYVDRDPHRRDAVAVLPFSVEGEVQVLLRRQVRYGQSLVSGRVLCLETVAGIIEAPEAPLATAAREIEEEVGLSLAPGSLFPLGQPFFILPGTHTERIFPFAAKIDRSSLEAAPYGFAPGDGSPFEEGAHQIAIGLERALELAERPLPEDPNAIWLADAKTELCLRRLKEHLARR